MLRSQSNSILAVQLHTAENKGVAGMCVTVALIEQLWHRNTDLAFILSSTEFTAIHTIFLEFSVLI